MAVIVDSPPANTEMSEIDPFVISPLLGGPETECRCAVATSDPETCLAVKFVRSRNCGGILFLIKDLTITDSTRYKVLSLFTTYKRLGLQHGNCLRY